MLTNVVKTIGTQTPKKKNRANVFSSNYYI